MFLKNLPNQPIDISKIRRIHLIGAGGIGMSGLRIWLEAAGYEVTCSDDAAKLSGFIPEDEFPEATDCIVVSSAIKDSHPQYRYAVINGIPVIHRAHCSKLLMHGRVVAISGAHGKTTCSGIISHVANQSLTTSFLIGGILLNYNTSAQWRHENDLCIVEADESDGSMNIMNGEYHLLTNLDEEHMEYYGTWENYLEQINKFANHPNKLVAHISCKSHLGRSDVMYYGYGSDVYAEKVEMNHNGSKFIANGPWGKWQINSKLIGMHMVDNLLGSILTLYLLGLSEDQIRSDISSFAGTKKRMERFERGGIVILQDYAHHPTELRSVINATRDAYSDVKLHVLWEPHKFSRLGYKDNFMSFIDALKQADHLLVLPVWSAGEEADPRFDHESIAMATGGVMVKSADEVLQYCKNNIKSKEVILCMGAGGIYKLVEKVISQL